MCSSSTDTYDLVVLFFVMLAVIDAWGLHPLIHDGLQNDDILIL